MVITETGSRWGCLAEGGLQPAFINNISHTYKQGGVYSVPIVTNSYRAKVQIIIEISKEMGIKKFPTIDRKVSFVLCG